MNFSKEPIVWIGAIIAIAMVLQDYLNGNLGWQTIDAALVAVGAAIGRSLVIPVEKIKDEDPYA